MLWELNLCLILLITTYVITSDFYLLITARKTPIFRVYNDIKGNNDNNKYRVNNCHSCGKYVLDIIVEP
jgi:hypothetical protein